MGLVFLRRHRPAHGRDAKLPAGAGSSLRRNFTMGMTELVVLAVGLSHGRLRRVRVQGPVPCRRSSAAATAI